MTGVVKGWCPSAYRPMMSGDGLIVRVKPRQARVTADQASAIADLSTDYGNGVIDLTSRANLQIRGVSETNHMALLSRLIDLGLVDADPESEARRTIVMMPFWQTGDLTDRVTQVLMARLPEFPDLPDKMGFAVDAGPIPMLAGVSGDIRFETSDDGLLLLRAEGARLGMIVDEAEAIDATLELAHWFVATGGRENGRMGRHLAKCPLPEHWQVAEPMRSNRHPVPGAAIGGQIVGVPFGSMQGQDLNDLIAESEATHLRVTPWRSLFLEAAKPVTHPAFIHAPGDSLLDIAACPGAPMCSSAEVETRPLARQLASKINGTLHVSGCAKGCARRSAAKITLVGRAGHFDLVENGCASDTPTRHGLSEADLLELLS